MSCISVQNQQFVLSFGLKPQHEGSKRGEGKIRPSGRIKEQRLYSCKSKKTTQCSPGTQHNLCHKATLSVPQPGLMLVRGCLWASCEKEVGPTPTGIGKILKCTQTHGQAMLKLSFPLLVVWSPVVWIFFGWFPIYPLQEPEVQIPKPPIQTINWLPENIQRQHDLLEKQP